MSKLDILAIGPTAYESELGKNRMKTTYYVAASLDGYIARADGDVSWLDELGIDMAETGYEAFYATVDGLVMGRGTYDWVFQYGTWPYGDKPTWVCTTQPLETIAGCNLQSGRTPAEVQAGAESRGVSHLWLVGGGRLAASFLEANLLTHLDISVMPIVLGGGIRLFADLEEPRITHLMRSESLSSGFARLRFGLD